MCISAIPSNNLLTVYLFAFPPSHHMQHQPSELNDLLECNSTDATWGKSAEVLVCFGIAVLFPAVTSAPWWKVSASFSSAGFSNDCISPFTRQFMVCLNLCSGKVGDTTTVVLNEETVLVWLRAFVGVVMRGSYMFTSHGHHWHW